MLIETDVLVAHVKESDWLKRPSEAILEAAESGELSLCASSESLHELYYLGVKLRIDLETLLAKIASLLMIGGIEWLPSTAEVSLTALTLMAEYGLSSIFDAYYAATALLMDPDRTVVSTDAAYDSVPGLRRVDPRDLARSLGTSGR